MTSASTTMVTRCPKCATAFRITSAQLQSAKGSVRCGSCLHVFKAQDHLVKNPAPTKAETAAVEKSEPGAPQPAHKPAPTTPSAPAAAAKSNTTNQATPAPKPSASASKPPVANQKPAATKPAAGTAPKTTPAQAVLKPTNPQKPAATKTVAPVIKKSSLDDIDDILISDDMDEKRKSKEENPYEHDDFLELDIKPQLNVSLFDRNIRDDKDDEVKDSADESWAEMLMDDEETKLVKAKPKSSEEEKAEAFYKDAKKSREQTPSKPNLVFSLVGESEHEKQAPDHKHHHDQHAHASTAHSEPALDSSIFETPDAEPQTTGRRQTKTDPKLRAYDGSSSRTALLMNIIPAPVEFTAKSIRRWYEHKLWPSLSALALFIMILQLAWLKFDYFSRVEPYRTAYLYLCPVVGCTLPALVDTKQIKAYNLLVRDHPDIENALLVDAIILNKAPFEQPFPDLVLAFSDMNDKPVASRRFKPEEYLGGELAGREIMPKETPIRLTLDLVDPGPDAVNYYVYIP